MNKSSNTPIISLNDLTEAVTHSVLNALSRRIDIEKFIERDRVVLFDPIITVGGKLALAKAGQLAGRGGAGGIG
jgi:hypothetical protein